MKKILLVGNGFDIAHGLKTSYGDFLKLMKKWNYFIEEYNLVKGDSTQLKNTSILKEYVTSVEMLNDISVTRLGEIIESNPWVKYYCTCGAEMDGWVDFEKEIVPVINMFTILLSELSVDSKDRVSGFEKFSIFGQHKKHHLKDEYKINVHKAKKKTVLKELREEFDDFIDALELYLHEFVYKRTDLVPLKQIKDIDADYIISLNYTLTEKLYGFSEEKTHHVHGRIRERWGETLNNMVLGIDENTCPNLDFVYFAKYFQRIQKRTGTIYKTFIDKTSVTTTGRVNKEEYVLYIYGHSLDLTDQDLLTYLIGNVENGSLKLKPKHVIIYFYDQEDYEKKVINLIDLYGRRIVESAIEHNWFEFCEIVNEPVSTESNK